MGRVSRQTIEDDVVLNREVDDLGCGVRTVSIEDEQDLLSGRVAGLRLGDEARLEPCGAEMIVCPPVRGQRYPVEPLSIHSH